MWIDERPGRPLRRIGTLVAAGSCAVALSALSAGSASAATPTPDVPYERSTGSCSKDDYTANFHVLYRNFDGRHYVDYLGWELTGGGEPIGMENKVVARVKDDNSLGHDPIYYTYRSPGNLGLDGGYRLGSGEVSVPATRRMYVEFTVTFDNPDGDDVTCVAHTRNV